MFQLRHITAQSARSGLISLYDEEEAHMFEDARVVVGLRSFDMRFCGKIINSYYLC